MASSNRHWPSMFKTKACNSHHPWQHDINASFVSNGCQKTPCSSGSEERTPEPKPRWNPRPEQIRILEAIFNSGMVNPPRDEIRKIRAQLQEYGQVGDANVFYWFQNRKSRSKHKQRQPQKPKSQPQQHHTSPPPPPPISSISTLPPPVAPPSSSSSSSEKCYANSLENLFSLCHASNSPPASVNQPFSLQSHQNEFLKVPFYLPLQHTGGSTGGLNQGLSPFPDLVDDNCSSFLLSDLLPMNHGISAKKAEDEKMMKMQQLLSNSSLSTTAPSTITCNPTTVSPTSLAALSTIHHTQCIGGVRESGIMGLTKSTVFINDVAFEVTMAPFNVREAFGDDAVLISSSGQPVLTNEWGVTLHPLQHGAFYYLIRTLTPSTLDTTVDLV